MNGALVKEKIVLKTQLLYERLFSRFSAYLKESALGLCFVSIGNAFQSIGPATEKALSPYFLCRASSRRQNLAAECRG